MVPGWQIAAFLVLIMVLLGFAIASSPNSYAYRFLTNRCGATPVPAACYPRGQNGGRVGVGGAGHW